MQKRSDVSTEAFRKFWHSQRFNDLIDHMVGHALTAEVKKNLTLDIEINRALQQERDAMPAFDGDLEVVWQSGGDLSALVGDPEFQRLSEEMEEIQREFVDFRESRRFFTEYGDEPL